MNIRTFHDIGDFVYLNTDPEQKQRIIIEILVKQNTLMYHLMCSIEDSWHYEIEFSKNKDVLKSVTN